MRSRYRSVLFALGVAGFLIALFSLGVFAQSYGTPHVISVRRSGAGITTQQAKSAAIDPGWGYAYALTQDTIVVFSDTTIVKTLSFGNPVAIETAPAMGYAYVPLLDRRMGVLDGWNVLTTSVPLEGGAGALATHDVTGYAYLTLPDEGAVAIFDGARKVGSVQTGRGPIALAVDSDHDKLYVANEGDPSLATVDLSSLTVITTSLSVTPTNVAVNPATQYVYVATEADSVMILEGDTPNLELKNTVPVPGPGEMAINSNADRVYVLSSPCGEPADCPGGAFVEVEVLSGDQSIHAITLDGPALTNAVQVNPSSGYVYAAVGRGGDGVVVIISDTQLIDAFPMTQAPMDIAVGGVDALERAYVPMVDGRTVIFGRGKTYGTGPISGGSGSATTLMCYGTNGLPVEIEIPAEAIPLNAGEVEVTCSAIAQDPVGASFIWAGQAFRISVLRNGAVLPDFTFEAGHPPELTATYDEAVLGGGAEAGVELRYQAGSADNPTWEAGASAGIKPLGTSPSSDQVAATIRYPGSYAVLTELRGVYLPLVHR